VIGGLSAVIGLGHGRPAGGLFASGFSEQLHQRRRKFEGEVDRIPRRGIISAEEGDRLKEIRDPARADRSGA
jgi:hypothetical protein